jgi:hypothetical protein
MRTFRAVRVSFLSALAALALMTGGAGCKRQEAPAPVAPSTPPATSPSSQAQAPAPAAPESKPLPPRPRAQVAFASATVGGGNSGAAIRLSPDIPHDVTVTGSDLASIQRDFDAYSWNTFISLIWPPGPDGTGDPSKKPGQEGDNPTVWEGWAESSSIFLPEGAKPAAWGSPPVLPPECKGLFTPGTRLLAQVGKTPGLLEAFSQPFDTGPLVDQHGRFARFELLVNEPMFNDIVNDGLYSKAGQRSFQAQGRTVQFACGDNAKPGAVGAIMVKAAWRVLDTAQGDDPSRFHSSTALVYTPALNNPKTPATCRKETVGLVGFHIAHKTNDASQWIWSTFEHVDNVPTEAEVKSGKLKPRYNFYNPGCKDCPVNAPPPRPWDPNKGAAPSQIVRVDVLPDFATTSAASHNEAAHKLLSAISPKSVWLNYELISTQWPTNTQFGKCQPFTTDPDGSPAPTFLANSTLESYVQGDVPNVSSSCIRCHGNATDTAGGDSDFTFLLERAR